MNGTLKIQEASLKGSIKGSGSLKGCIKGSANLSGKVSIATGYDSYSGPCSVDPDFTKITLNTKNKVMPNDVTVNEIGVSKTPNDGGGYTVYIG